jgi:nucleotide-binding universal stress UspA family protein
MTFRPKHGLGRLGDHLVELAEEERSDLIVLGTHHKRGLARLGSVASVTLRYSHSAVAVVPLPEGELLAPDEVPCIRRVLVPTDLSPVSNHAVPFGYALLGERGGEIYILHVLPDGRRAASETEVVAQLRSLVPKRGVPDDVTTRTEVIQHSNAARAIYEAAERLGADAICMSSHGRSGSARLGGPGPTFGVCMRDGFDRGEVRSLSYTAVAARVPNRGLPTAAKVAVTSMAVISLPVRSRSRAASRTRSFCETMPTRRSCASTTGNRLT